MSNTIYISGKISNTDDYMERFNQAEEELKAKGYTEIINPALVNSNLPKSTTYEQYMKMSLCMLDIADGIYMLDGWENSKGAKLEYEYAVALGKEIVYQRGE